MRLRQSLLFRLLDLQTQGQFSPYYREICRTQWLGRASILELQLTKLQRVLAHCAHHVPFYRERFRACGFDADKLKDFGDLRKIPILTKDEVIKNEDRLRAANYSTNALVKKSTGGSSGKLLAFYQDKMTIALNFAHNLRNYNWCGLRVGDRHVLLWGTAFDLKAQENLQRRIINSLMNQRYLDAFNCSDSRFNQYFRILQKERPVLLTGYANALYHFAESVEARGFSYDNGLSVASTAELLTTKQRAMIEKVFHCRVFDRFGCREIGNTAHECERHDGLHINAEHVHVEYVDDNDVPVPENYEQPARVIYTSLNNLAFPLVRYEVGDLAVPCNKICDCGRGLPMMRVVMGRTSDMIRKPDGTGVHGEYFSHLFYSYTAIKDFQVIQERLDRLLIDYTTKDGNNLEMTQEREIKIRLRSMFGAQVEVEIQRRPEIKRLGSGKFRFTACLLRDG